MKFLCFSVCFLLLFTCSEPTIAPPKIKDFVPENSELIIKTSNLENLKSSISNSDFLQKLLETSSLKKLNKTLEHIYHFKPQSDILICLGRDTNDSIQFSVITKYHSELFTTDSLKNYSEESLKYQDKTITKSTINNTVFYSAIINNFFFSSSSKTLVEAAHGKKTKNIDFEKIYATVDNNKTVSIIIKPKNSFIKSCFKNDLLNQNFFANYIAIDADVSQNSIILNGITKPKDSTKNLINVFKGTIPQAYTIQNITPATSDGFMSFTFDNFKLFKSNLNAYSKINASSKNTPLFNNIIEVGVIYENENSTIVLNSLDPIITSDALLAEQNIIETYREVDIINFSQSQLFSKTFYPLIENNTIKTYCVLDNYFVFASNTETLQNIITNYQNKTTLGERSYFNEITSKLTDESSLIYIGNTSSLTSILKKNGLEIPSSDLDDYPLSAIQFIYDTNFAYINGVINKSKAPIREQSISEELHIKLEKDLLTNPQFVINHTTKEKEIVVQDIDNNLYLISNTGNIIWKKALSGPVLGNIEQIDVLKNGKLQLAFATAKHIYVIDRNGNDVAPFPKKFNDEITQPLSVFDYDKKKDYRLLITQGQKLSMYNKSGNFVKGFNFKSADNTLITQPKHIRIETKDYIVFKTNSKLYFLDRTGKPRTTPKTTTSFSNSDIFLYKNKFITTTSAGKVLLINPDGKFTSQNFNISSDQHSLTTTDRTFVLHSENKLYINKNTVELDYGNYSAPEIFYINDKIYVSITDLQSQKIYVFDSQGKLLPNFPAYGNSAIKLDHIDTDKHLEFITKGDSNSIIMYQLN